MNILYTNNQNSLGCDNVRIASNDPNVQMIKTNEIVIQYKFTFTDS
ncbi:hypothetical protein [Virgibacillus sp. Bac332]|nr:hypothetical protein [Virgibacillus sp. Bac332]